MKLDKIQKEILTETKAFAKINDIHFDVDTYCMVANALFEYKQQLNKKRNAKNGNKI